MITNEAIEAGAKALWDIDREVIDREYQDCRDETKRHLRREARAALEAAAPHMLPAPLDPEFALEVATENYRIWLDENDDTPRNP